MINLYSFFTLPNDVCFIEGRILPLSEAATKVTFLIGDGMLLDLEVFVLAGNYDYLVHG